MAVISRADATWAGPLLTGTGAVSAVSSHAFSDLPLTWSARTEDHGPLTSPEELLAAAHASCFAMQLASNLNKAGTPATTLDVSSNVTFDKLEAWTVVSSALTVRGTVPGISAEDFASIARETGVGCPISRALKGNLEITVEAILEG